MERFEQGGVGNMGRTNPNKEEIKKKKKLQTYYLKTKIKNMLYIF